MPMLIINIAVKLSEDSSEMLLFKNLYKIMGDIWQKFHWIL